MSREELIEAVYNNLRKLDGTDLTAIALIAGFDLDDIKSLGGLE